MRTFSRITALSLATMLLAAPGARSENTLTIAAPQRLHKLLGPLIDAFAEANPDQMVTLVVESDARLPGLTKKNVALVAWPRPLNAEEARLFRLATDENLYGVPFALDAAVLVVNPTNPLRAITFAQLADIYAGRTENWASLGLDLDPTGNHVHTPDCILEHPTEAFIFRHLPTSSNGVTEVLRSRIFHKQQIAAQTKPCESVRDTMNAVVNDPLGLGVVGHGFQEGVRALAVDTGNGEAVPPTPQTIASRAYPLTHYHYFYSAGPPTGSVRAFIAFVTGTQGQSIIAKAEAGPLPIRPATAPD